MKAVILAGGKGTRLKGKTQACPKVLVEIADRPVIDYQLEWLSKEGIKEVVLLLGHLGDQVEDFCGDGSRWNLKISYSIEPKPLGTVGALKHAENIITKDTNKSDFLVVYGDVILDLNLKSLIEFHKSNLPCDGTLMVHPNDHPYDSDLVEFDENNKIVCFHGKPHDPNRYYHNQVNAAVYILNESIFKVISTDGNLDLGRDIFPKLVKEKKFYAYVTAEYLKDMGSPERLLAVEKDILSGKVNRLNKKNKRPAVFIDRDGVICRHNDYIFKPEQLEIFEDVTESILKLNQTDYLSIMVTNQPVIARGLTDIVGLNEIHKKLESLLGSKGSRLDGIYFCPHHPDSGFEGEVKEYKITCDCRKPGAGMLYRAAEHYNIDLSKSFIIGDTWRDIGAGINAKLKATIGILNGIGRVGDFSKFQPDYKCKDLLSAVDYILNQ